MTLTKKHLLLMTVFLTGAAVLVVEVVATRILAPYFGNTIFTVSSVLAVVLGALSVGYVIGGRLADRHPALRWFFGIILASGISVLLLQLLTVLVLPLVGYRLSVVSGPLVASVVLFFLPSVLLGMLSPFAIRLGHDLVPAQGLGSVAGEVFFWSTLGSISGSLLAGFILIPRFGLSTIVLSTGIVLSALGGLPMFRRLDRPTVARLLLFLFSVSGLILLSSSVTSAGVVYQHDGVYERIVIRDQVLEGKRTRLLLQDRSVGAGMLLDSDGLAFDYTKYVALAPLLAPKFERALAIGGGAYSVPKALLKLDPNVRVEVAEIEPSLYDLSKRYFRLADDPRLTNHVVDGRRFLHDSRQHYDLIFSDVYYSLFSIPAHFTTREFFDLARQQLALDGVLIANLVGKLEAGHTPSLLLSEIKTFRASFPNSAFFAVTSPTSPKRQNVMAIGVNGNRTIDPTEPELAASTDPIVRGLKDKRIDLNRFDFSKQLEFTDDYAPVDYLTARELN